MPLKTRLPCVLACMLLGLPALTVAAENDPGAWFVFVASDRLPGKSAASAGGWRYWLEAQARYPDAGSGINQLLIRPALGYAFSPSVSAFAGYARFRTHGRGGRTSTEDRLWQHLAWRFRASGPVSMTMRFRLEQRRLSGSDDTGLLFRYQLGYVRQFAADDKLAFTAGLEPFFDLRDTDYGARRGLNQVRLSAAIRRTLAPGTSVSVGYQNQYVRSPGGTDRSNHLVMLTLRTRF